MLETIFYLACIFFTTFASLAPDFHHRLSSDSSNTKLLAALKVTLGYEDNFLKAFTNTTNESGRNLDYINGLGFTESLREGRADLRANEQAAVDLNNTFQHILLPQLNTALLDYTSEMDALLNDATQYLSTLIKTLNQQIREKNINDPEGLLPALIALRHYVKNTAIEEQTAEDLHASFFPLSKINALVGGGQILLDHKANIENNKPMVSALTAIQNTLGSDTPNSEQAMQASENWLNSNPLAPTLAAQLSNDGLGSLNDALTGYSNSLTTNIPLRNKADNRWTRVSFFKEQLPKAPGGEAGPRNVT